jgi:carbon monoxide dehydrogenase subunit G
MELTNSFQVNVPVADAWAILTDVERIAPCMPGADLQEVEGDEYRGVVKVKVGPITAQYKGAARFIEKDDAAHKAVLKAEGRDTRGAGNASATITATLREVGGGTEVQVDTDLTVSGKVAQFGRGVLADVSGKLLTQFVDCLEADVLGGKPGAGETPPPEGDWAEIEELAPPGPPTGPPHTVPTGPPTAAAGRSNGSEGAPAVRKIESRPAAPVDLLGTAGAPMAKRAAPLIAILFLVAWLFRRRRRSRRQSRG